MKSKQPGRLAPGWHLVSGVAPGDLPEGVHGWLRRVGVDNAPRLPLGPLQAGGRFEVVLSVEGGDFEAFAELPGLETGERPIGVETSAIGRGAALSRMLRGEGSGSSAGAVASRLARTIVGFLRGGARGGVYALASAYQVPLWPDMGRHGIPCTVTLQTGIAWRGAWVPVNELAAACGEDGTEAIEWTALGADPQFQLRRSGLPFGLPAGWYEVQFEAEVVEGSLLSPTLFPDYGRGCQHHEQIRLPEPGPSGVLRATVMLREPVSALRFDPSVRQARFRVQRFTLRKLGRVRALVGLLGARREADGSLDYRALAHRSARFLRDAARDGLSNAAARLHRQDDGDAGTTYERWVHLYDTFDRSDVAMMRTRASRLVHRPRFSILLPVYETPEKWLRRCLDSILSQAYPEWELCIVDDASSSPHVRRVLEAYLAKDSRIRVTWRATNGHISRASNDALAMATGDYIALMDHDDELRPHALLEMAERMQADPGLRLLYSDEDKIDVEGQRMQPYFKPDWNPDLLLSQNYLCHFTVLDRQLVEDVGGFREGFEGSQDHDLFLRCTAALAAGQIGHVHKVLYHWRAIPGSTAHQRSAKDYASSAGLRAVADHLSRHAPGAEVLDLAHGHYRVVWPLPDPAPRVSILIPTRDRVDLLSTCVESLVALTDYPDLEIIVVDNQSEDPATLSYLESLRERPGIRVLSYDAPFNYSAINNWAASQASGDVLCLLNNDIEVVDGAWLREMVGHALRDEVGAVGAMLLYPDYRIQHAGVVLGLGGVANHIYCGLADGAAGHGARALVAQDMSAVTAACLVVRKDVYVSVGGLDERLQVAFNDVDFCLRLRRAGLWNVWTPFARLLHHESASRGRDEEGEKRERFLREVAHMEAEWKDWLEADPGYNRNLSLEKFASEPAFPPRA